MATTIRFRRRATGQTAGAPATAKSGEPNYNMTDGVIYIGYGDDGSGNATSVKAIGKDDFWRNIPSNGSDGNILFRTASGVQWGPAPEGALYTASGDGIELSGSQFQLNYTEVAAGVGLGNYITTTAANAAYQPKDGDLTAIAALAGTTGLLRKTGADTWQLDTTDLATQTELDNALTGKANATHTHSAADITSGVLDIARIPVLPSQKTIVSSGTIANLTAGQQTEIGEGTIITTTDGRRWVYSGAGSKTAEASYIELADTTPEWTTIANKPSFATVATSGSYIDLSNRPSLATVATSGSYTDLSNRPTLGTMAAQNANSVNITGGSIDGVTIDGGTF